MGKRQITSVSLSQDELIEIMAASKLILGRPSITGYFRFLHQEFKNGESLQSLIEKHEAKLNWQQVLNLCLEILVKLDHLEITRDLHNPELDHMIEELIQLIKVKDDHKAK